MADSHIGFDLPLRPRITRRRRGVDFLANLQRALAPALEGRVDMVVHGGDLFYRSRVPPAIIEKGLTPLVEVARSGVPVFLVPGNHERGAIPPHLWRAQPGLHIFDRPRGYEVHVGETRVVLLGFPFERRARRRFRDALGTAAALVETVEHAPSHAASEPTGAPADPTGAADPAQPPADPSDAPPNPRPLRLLCMHQAVEGARVGHHDYTFRRGRDVVRAADLPPVTAVLAGHIHRGQILTRTLVGRPLPAPVLYPGSVERTSFTESRETKGYFLLHFHEAPSGWCLRPAFRPLPARPMTTLEVDASALSLEAVGRRLRDLDPDAVVRVRVVGPAAAQAALSLSDRALRAVAPATMNVSWARPRVGTSPRRPRRT